MSERYRRLLKRDMTIPELVEASKDILSERSKFPFGIRDSIIQQLYDRVGLSYREITDLTGYPMHVVFGAARRRPKDR